jgi:hypothetical protein
VNILGEFAVACLSPICLFFFRTLGDKSPFSRLYKARYAVK